MWSSGRTMESDPPIRGRCHPETAYVWSTPLSYRLDTLDHLLSHETLDCQIPPEIIELLFAHFGNRISCLLSPVVSHFLSLQSEVCTVLRLPCKPPGTGLRKVPEASGSCGRSSVLFPYIFPLSYLGWLKRTTVLYKNTAQRSEIPPHHKRNQNPNKGVPFLWRKQ